MLRASARAQRASGVGLSIHPGFGPDAIWAAVRILEKEKRLRVRSNRYWTELDRENYNFDSREQLADAVRLITKDEFVKFYKRFLLSENRKRVVARSTGNQHKTEFAEKERAQKYIVIRDPDSFKEGKKYFPRYDDTP